MRSICRRAESNVISLLCGSQALQGTGQRILAPSLPVDHRLYNPLSNFPLVQAAFPQRTLLTA